MAAITLSVLHAKKNYVINWNMASLGGGDEPVPSSGVILEPFPVLSPPPAA